MLADTMIYTATKRFMINLHTKSPQFAQLIQQGLKSEIVLLMSIYGELSDELHFFWLAIRKESFLILLEQKSSFLDAPFMEHVQRKFQDLSKVENLDAQIFYQTQWLRHDSANYMRVKANSRIPNLIKLLKKRIEMDECDANKYRY